MRGKGWTSIYLISLLFCLLHGLSEAQVEPLGYCNPVWLQSWGKSWTTSLWGRRVEVTFEEINSKCIHEKEGGVWILLPFTCYSSLTAESSALLLWDRQAKEWIHSCKASSNTKRLWRGFCANFSHKK